jgi:glycosyltransferase involved in cell wall biosynthesis
MAMEIVFLCSSFPRYDGDGASVFLLKLAKALVQKKYRIHVIAPHDSHVDPDWEPEGVVIHRFRYTIGSLRLAYGAGILPNLRRNPFLWMLVPGFVLAMTWKTWRITRRHHFDVLHAHWILPAGLIATMLRPLHGIPTIVTAHGSDIYGLRGRLGRFLRRYTLANCNAWTANTPTTQESAADRGVPPGNVIPMGVESNQFVAGNRTQGRGTLDNELFLILFVGRLIDVKGADVLLRAVSTIDNNRRIGLWIVGDGPDRPALEQTADRLGIKDRVKFWGQMGYDKLPDLYAAADVFVLPSRKIPGIGEEGQGTVILEAMAAGCCVIGSDSGGIGTLIEHDKTGVLVPPDDPQMLAKAIERLMTDPDMRRHLARAGRALVNRQYDWNIIAGQFSRLYGHIR